ncbi:DUF1214 domain-containing protein [Maricaulis sp.]|uniref:DUF1214 domain-containing protein n=1 Tax=unclassified Maricaulis TaxID=2632371 RepID=UPI001B256470|nr:DUF1214 domain-containing protein [Maricaulis sp.]MBO6795639.1 DUF1214 domain-containing protein [Maricaulis sp.]
MIIRSLLAGLGGLVLGAAAAVFLVFGPADFGGVSVGPWRTNIHVGSPDAPDIVRAVVARRGLLALNRSETIYFSADADSEGRPLEQACDYRILFTDRPDARWWSLTLYAEDDFLPVGGPGAYSISADAIGAEETGFVVSVSERPAIGHWMSPENAGAFNLTLRLYNPGEAIVEDPATAVLPVVERLACGGGA